jgi:hypothetical protein
VLSVRCVERRSVHRPTVWQHGHNAYFSIEHQNKIMQKVDLLSPHLYLQKCYQQINSLFPCFSNTFHCTYISNFWVRTKVFRCRCDDFSKPCAHRKHTHNVHGHSLHIILKQQNADPTALQPVWALHKLQSWLSVNEISVVAEQYCHLLTDPPSVNN